MTDFAFKSTLVVKRGVDTPVIETFHAETEDALLQQQEQWMSAGGYSVADMKLYRRSSDGGWQLVDECPYQRMPQLPPFVWLRPAENESPAVKQLLAESLLQVSTGRVVRIRPKGQADDTGLFPTNILYNLGGGQFVFTADLLHPSEADLDMMAFHDEQGLVEVLREELYIPLKDWLLHMGPSA